MSEPQVYAPQPPDAIQEGMIVPFPYFIISSSYLFTKSLLGCGVYRVKDLDTAARTMEYIICNGQRQTDYYKKKKGRKYYDRKREEEKGKEGWVKVLSSKELLIDMLKKAGSADRSPFNQFIPWRDGSFAGKLAILAGISCAWAGSVTGKEIYIPDVVSCIFSDEPSDLTHSPLVAVCLKDNKGIPVAKHGYYGVSGEEGEVENMSGVVMEKLIEVFRDGEVERILGSKHVHSGDIVEVAGRVYQIFNSIPTAVLPVRDVEKEERKEEVVE